MMTQNSILENYFRDYAQYHRTKGNQRTHLLGIPMIVIAVLSWLSRVWIIRPEEWMTAGVPLSLIRWDLAIAVLIVVSAWYTFLNWRLGAPFFLVFIWSSGYFSWADGFYNSSVITFTKRSRLRF
jgi:uncharacterized membrane protein YGL010W